MGMDNTFYKVKKKEFKKLDYELHEYYQKCEPYEECEILYFRKNYVLNETINDVLDEYIMQTNLNKRELKKIIEKLKESEEEYTNPYKTTTIKETITSLEVILKLFDFKNYYLVYQMVH